MKWTTLDVRWSLLSFPDAGFYALRLPPHCPKMNKTPKGEVKKNSRFRNQQLYTVVSRKDVQQKRKRQYRKVLWVMEVHGALIKPLGGFSDIERNSTNKCYYAFSFLVGRHREPWLSTPNSVFLRITPISIVAYAFALLWDNLCRNDCINLSWILLKLIVSARPGD